MGYNNDVDMVKVFGQLYKVFLGTKPDDPTFVELFYSVGLALGIFLFFNHVPGKKVTNEPTPIQVQMRLYEQDVNRTFLLGASRKGEELDVSGNNDSANNKLSYFRLGCFWCRICCGRWVYCIYQFDWNCNKAGRTHENGRRNPDLRK